MNLNEFAFVAHKNAVEHGWYSPEPEDSVIFANIMGEWAEAFEEYKAGKPDLYYHCTDRALGADAICEHQQECYWRKVGGKADQCSDRNPKPEGVAAELIDGAIRILDYIGWQMEKNAAWNTDLNASIAAIRGTANTESITYACYVEDVPRLVCELNVLTGYALDNGRMPTVRRFYLCICLFFVFEYCKLKGINPDALMLDKHQYNKSRSYRHGGKVC